MKLKQESYEVEGKEKSQYLHRLDISLHGLSRGLFHEKDKERGLDIVNFGRDHNWDLTRLPTKEHVYASLAHLVERVRQEYHWFNYNYFEHDPSMNFGYFDKSTISAESGLPWAFDFIELHSLKKDSTELLARHTSYETHAEYLYNLLRKDEVEPKNVLGKVEEIHKQSMKRSFLERLNKHELLGWDSQKHSLPPRAKKVMSMPGEDLWNLEFITYSPASSQFQVYVMDLWQDTEEPQITEVAGHVKVSDQLVNSLRFGEDNAAWFIIQSIDEKFRSLHPVQVSRGLVGPFENKYLTNPNGIKVLDITKDLLAEDQESSLLRFSRQYSYAPNHEVKGKEIRQVLHIENWSDEFIVCDKKNASRVSSSILGTNVKVIGIKL